MQREKTLFHACLLVRFLKPDTAHKTVASTNGSSHQLTIKTVPRRDAHGPASSKQSLTKSLFLGDSSLCPVVSELTSPLSQDHHHSLHKLTTSHTTQDHGKGLHLGDLHLSARLELWLTLSLIASFHPFNPGCLSVHQVCRDRLNFSL